MVQQPWPGVCGQVGGGRGAHAVAGVGVVGSGGHGAVGRSTVAEKAQTKAHRLLRLQMSNDGNELPIVQGLNGRVTPCAMNLLKAQAAQAM